MAMKYGFAQMMHLSDNIHSVSGKLNSSHEELKGYVNGLVSQWESQARDDYYKVQQDWDNAHQELIQTLATISNVVRDGTAHMQETENRNAASWS